MPTKKKTTPPEPLWGSTPTPEQARMLAQQRFLAERSRPAESWPLPGQRLAPPTPDALANTQEAERYGAPSPWMAGHPRASKTPTMGPARRTPASTVYDAWQTVKDQPVLQLLGGAKDLYEYADQQMWRAAEAPGDAVRAWWSGRWP